MFKSLWVIRSNTYDWQFWCNKNPSLWLYISRYQHENLHAWWKNITHAQELWHTSGDVRRYDVSRSNDNNKKGKVTECLHGQYRSEIRWAMALTVEHRPVSHEDAHIAKAFLRLIYWSGSVRQTWSGPLNLLFIQ